MVVSGRTPPVQSVAENVTLIAPIYPVGFHELAVFEHTIGRLPVPVPEPHPPQSVIYPVKTTAI